MMPFYNWVSKQYQEFVSKLCVCRLITMETADTLQRT